MFNKLMRRYAAPLAALAVLSVPGSSLLADVITVGKTGKGLDFQGTVIGIDAGQLVFRATSTGNETRRPLDDVMKIKVDNEPKLTQAEEAYVAGNMPVAAQAYQQALTATQKDWVRERAVYRLVDAASKAGNFEAAVAAYAELLKRNPTAAAENKPAIPKEKPEFVKQGIAEAKRAQADPRLRPEQKAALGSYLFDMYMAIGDAQGMGEVGGGRVPANVDDGGVSVMNSAKLQFVQRNYPAVLQAIEQGKAKITASDQQFEALWLIAECKHVQATTANTIPAFQDAAIAYMRLVAHFGGKSKDARVGDALLKAGIIVERCNQKAEALKIFEELVDDDRYKNTPVGQQAKAGIARIKAAPKTAG